MLDTEKILKLCSMIEKGYSYSEIRGTLGVGNHTIKRYREIMNENGLCVKQLEGCSEEEVIDLFYERKTRDVSIPYPDYPEIYKRVTAKKNRSNQFVEWRKYKEENPDGYQYSQFCSHFGEWLKENVGAKSLKMVIDRQPGQYIFVDWSGDTSTLVADHGTLATAHFFVTTLGLSSKLFVMAFPNEKSQAVVTGMNKAFQYYGALPERIMVDNMKSAVAKNSDYEVILSKAFQDLEDFYDTPVIPARPLSPSDYRQNQNIGNFTLLGHTYRT